MSLVQRPLISASKRCFCSGSTQRSLSTATSTTAALRSRCTDTKRSCLIEGHTTGLRQQFATTAQRRTFWWSSSASGATGAAGAAASGSPFAGAAPGLAAWETLDMLPQVSTDLLPLLFAILLAAQSQQEEEDGDHDSEPNSKLFTVKAVSDKGLGAFAKRDIARGEVIIRERPLFIWPTSLDATTARGLVEQLSPSARQAFFSLANAAEPDSKLDEVLAIRATNAFAVQLPPLPNKMVPAGPLLPPNATTLPSTASFIFPRIARINHSCAPNADHSMDWRVLKMFVYATTPIAESEEVCIEYTSGLMQMSRDARREILKRDFGFECHCSVCSQTGDALAKSDSRRREIDAIVGTLGSGDLSRKDMWSALQRMDSLLQQEGYKAMPEFSNPRISAAYVGFKEIQQRKGS